MKSSLVPVRKLKPGMKVELLAGIAEIVDVGDEYSRRWRNGGGFVAYTAIDVTYVLNDELSTHVTPTDTSFRVISG